MPSIAPHRAIPATKMFRISAKGSFFRFVDSLKLSENAVTPLRRSFSYARMHGAASFIREKLDTHTSPSYGIIHEENEYIKSIFPDYHCNRLERISFWRKHKSPSDMSNIDLIGYLILKNDSFFADSFLSIDYIFESVFSDLPNTEIYIPHPKKIEILIDKKNFSVQGKIYSQQNSVTKTCAQVALYSIISSYIAETPSFVKINEFAKVDKKRVLSYFTSLRNYSIQNQNNNSTSSDKKRSVILQNDINTNHPSSLTSFQIDDVLKNYEINFFYEDFLVAEQKLSVNCSSRRTGPPNGRQPSNSYNLVDKIIGLLQKISPSEKEKKYKKENEELQKSFRQCHPYYRMVYIGVESGYGALVSFYANPQKDIAHLLPIFGHSFDRNAWAPHAEPGYFQKIKNNQFKQSSLWLNSFIAHDDNFGINFSIPSLFDDEKVVHVWELSDKNATYSGVAAEILACHSLESLISFYKEKGKDIIKLPNPTTDAYWFNYLLKENIPLVVRTLFVTKERYLEHIKKTIPKDYECPAFQTIPKYIWLTEFSTYQLFSVNRAKIGEVILDASVQNFRIPDSVIIEKVSNVNLPEKNENYFKQVLCGIRIPGAFLLHDHKKADLNFLPIPTQTTSYSDCMSDGSCAEISDV